MNDETIDDEAGAIQPIALSALQAQTLDAVLNLIIPPSQQRGLPGAADAGVADYISREAPDLAPTLIAELDRVEAESRQRFSQSAVALEHADLQSLVDALRRDRPGFMDRLAFETYSCYYQDDRVLDVIGLEKRAPYPKGYEVVAGDLNLLRPVRKRGRIYREVD